MARSTGASTAPKETTRADGAYQVQAIPLEDVRIVVDTDEALQGTCVSRGISMRESRADVMHTEKLVSRTNITVTVISRHAYIPFSIRPLLIDVASQKHRKLR